MTIGLLSSRILILIYVKLVEIGVANADSSTMPTDNDSIPVGIYASSPSKGVFTDNNGTGTIVLNTIDRQRWQTNLVRGMPRRKLCWHLLNDKVAVHIHLLVDAIV